MKQGHIYVQIFSTETMSYKICTIKIKKMKESIKTPDCQLREGPIVYVYATIFDDYQTFKEFYFVTTHEVLSKTYESCSKLIEKRKRSSKAVYNEAINLAFRPKVSINDICISFLKYICFTLREGDLKPENPQEALHYMAHLHLDNDNWSRCGILSRGILKKYLRIDDEFRWVGESDISMALPSKLRLLNKLEMSLLDHLFELIYDSNESVIKLIYGQFWDLLDPIDAKSEEGFTKDEIDGMLNTLVFYDFITVDFEWVTEDNEEICLFVISIIDLPNYYDFLRFTEIIP